MNEFKTILRFITAGSVDDGKSTLIGRLFRDADLISDDQLEAMKTASQKKGFTTIDLSFYTDGLKDERVQGITIDVAYRYFSTKNRKFIVGDTPGHVQYTRNMVTAASSAHLAIILIDARKGVTEQTRRHCFITSLVGIEHVIVCINKMDLTDYSESRFKEIQGEFMNFAIQLDIPDIRVIPVSAFYGDNIVHKSDKMPWYQGATLLHTLENIEVSQGTDKKDLRIPVQTIIRNPENLDFRGYAGKIASGVIKTNDEIMVLPSGQRAKVVNIITPRGNVQEACAPQSVCITINEELDISRGDMFVSKHDQPIVMQEIEAMICWLGLMQLEENSRWIIRQTTREARAVVKEIAFSIDLTDLKRIASSKSMQTNDIGKIRIRVTQPLMCEPYRLNRTTGAFILIDESTNNTVAAGMIV
jgi:sulfate adenylyltransferase subunit 1